MSSAGGLRAASVIASSRVRRAGSGQPLRSGPVGDEAYAQRIVARMLEIVARRQLNAVKSKLQRINPQEQPDEHARLFGELIALESYHRGLRERAHGAS